MTILERFETTSLISEVLEAMSQAGLTTVREIHMGNTRGLNLDRMTHHDIDVFKNAFVSLKSLSLSLVSSGYPSDHELVPDSIPRFCKVLADSPSLEELSIDTGYVRDHEDDDDQNEDSVDISAFMNAFYKESFPSLKKLGVHGPEIEIKKHLAFSARHHSLLFSATWP